MNHATVKRDGFDVPLIGIPREAALERCDCCRRQVPMMDTVIRGDTLICLSCLESEKTVTTNIVEIP